MTTHPTTTPGGERSDAATDAEVIREQCDILDEGTTPTGMYHAICVIRARAKKMEDELLAARAALAVYEKAMRFIANWSDDAMANACTLHYDMRGTAQAALADAGRANAKPEKTT